MDQELTLHIVPHTHWDREWYFTLEEFRYRLIKLMDTLLRCMEDESITYFVLDGQTIALSDYLEIRPENRERLEKLIRNRRLIIGPWYTQPNTFMSGAEAQVRNLLRGKQDMSKYGAVMSNINYLPDQFGFNSQMPQLMAGFEMTHLVGARGLPKCSHTYIKWEGSDKTTVKVCVLPNSYNNANGFCDRTEQKIFSVFGETIMMPSLPDRLNLVLKEQERAIAPQLLALNGVDHMFPNTSMRQTLAKIEELHPEIKVIQSNFSIYIDAVEATLKQELITVTGEQRDPRENVILPASQSMRMDIKKYNRRMEDFLVRYVEPAICVMKSIGEENLPLALLKKAWEYMLENQAHDSLCCANSEPSYREIYTRFEKIEDIGREINNEIYQRFIRRICNLPQEAVLLINPTPEDRNEPITLDIIVSNNRNFAEPHLFYDGEEIPAYVQSVHTDMLLRFVPFSGRVGQLSVAVFKITIQPGIIPAMGYKLLEIKGGGLHDSPVCGIVKDLRQLENEYLKVTVNANATLDITDKRTNRTYREVHSFIDNGETGDGFQHIPPYRDRIAVSGGRDINISIVENNQETGILNISQSLSVPKDLSPDKLSRSDEYVNIDISSDVILRSGCSYVEFKTHINNKAKNHRLRVAFPTDIESLLGFAGQPFDIVERPIQPENVNHLEPGDYEPFVGYHPMHDFCGISDSKTGVTISGDGIMEYEILPMRNALCLTLIRATERIYCDVLATGSKFNIPQAQLLGENDFRYAFIPYSGSYDNSLKSVECFRYPIKSVQKDFLEEESMPDYKAPNEILPKTGGFVRVNGDFVISTFKPSEDGNGFILRLYNPVDHQELLKVIVDSSYDILVTELVRLDETSIEIITALDNVIEMMVESKKIISIKLVLKIRNQERSYETL
jgi:mannosylglycerate hydrolase